MIDKESLTTLITVDGGIDEINVRKLSALGVSNFVVGSRIFKDGKVKENIQTIKKSIY